MEGVFSITPLCPPMEKEKGGVGRRMADFISVGSTWLWELIWPCAVSVPPWDLSICVCTWACVCVCVCVFEGLCSLPW